MFQGYGIDKRQNRKVANLSNTKNCHLPRSTIGQGGNKHSMTSKESVLRCEKREERVQLGLLRKRCGQPEGKGISKAQKTDFVSGGFWEIGKNVATSGGAKIYEEG